VVAPKKKAEPRSDLGASRTGILDAITAPLGFFVLALLIVETFLGTVLIGADLERQDKIIGMWAGVGMFVLVILVVYSLVWFKPQNLTYDKTAHLMERGKMPWGNAQNPLTADKVFTDPEKGPKL
jgi:hypothetical protein